MNFVSRLYWLIFKVYHYTVSPALHLLSGFGFGCRFQPTCSHYAYGSIQEHGLWRGMTLALRRFSRCHPFSSAPFDDPVLRKLDL
jgi:putative membrane protein insertion efficiency factor